MSLADDVSDDRHGLELEGKLALQGMLAAINPKCDESSNLPTAPRPPNLPDWQCN